MSRIADCIALLNGTSVEPLRGAHPGDGALRSLLVHAAFADGEVGPGEFDLIHRVMPELELAEALLWIAAESERPMDIARLMSAFPTRAERVELLELAAVITDKDDGELPSELEFLQALGAMLSE